MQKNIDVEYNSNFTLLSVLLLVFQSLKNINKMIVNSKLRMSKVKDNNFVFNKIIIQRFWPKPVTRNSLACPGPWAS